LIELNALKFNIKYDQERLRKPRSLNEIDFNYESSHQF